MRLIFEWMMSIFCLFNRAQTLWKKFASFQDVIYTVWYALKQNKTTLTLTL